MKKDMVDVNQLISSLSMKISIKVSLVLIVVFIPLSSFFLVKFLENEMDNSFSALSKPLANAVSLGNPYDIKTQLRTLVSSDIFTYVLLKKIPNHYILDRYSSVDLNEPLDADGIFFSKFKIFNKKTYSLTLNGRKNAELVVVKEIPFFYIIYLFIILIAIILFMIPIFRFQSKKTALEIALPLKQFNMALDQEELIVNNQEKINKYKEIESIFDSFVSLLTRLKRQQQEIIEQKKNHALTTQAKKVAHDIRSPLTVLNMLLQGGDLKKESHSQMLKSTIERINSIADDLLKKTKEQEESSFAKTSIKETIKKLIKEKRVEYSGKENNFSISFTDTTERDFFTILSEQSLSRILSNLMNNSRDAALNSDLCIIIAIESRKNFCEIIIEDNGEGMDKYTLSKLNNGTLGSFGKTDSQSSGSGIGVKSSMEELKAVNSSLHFISEKGKGTKAIISLRVI